MSSRGASTVAPELTPTSPPAGWLTVTAVLVGFILGAITSPAQGMIGDSLGSVANSAGPWCLGAFLVARRTTSPVYGAVLAMASLAMCEIGYVVSAQVRDVPSSVSTVLFWLTAAAIAGPPIGIAAVWSRQLTTLRFGAGVGVLSGILLGEGLYGMLRLSDTTNSTYWLGEAVLGVAVGCYVYWRARAPRPMLGWVGVTALTALVVYTVATVA